MRPCQTNQPQLGQQTPKATCRTPGETSRRHTKLNSASIAIPKNWAQINGCCFKALIFWGEGFEHSTITHTATQLNKSEKGSGRTSVIRLNKQTVQETRLSPHSTVCSRYIYSNLELLSVPMIPALAVYGFLFLEGPMRISQRCKYSQICQ